MHAGCRDLLGRPPDDRPGGGRPVDALYNHCSVQGAEPTPGVRPPALPEAAG